MNSTRKLIYEERPTREHFGVNDSGSLNHLIYDHWLLTRKELNPLETDYYSKIATVFNDAYFICTVALIDKSKELNLFYFGDKVSYPAVVYPLACFYLSMLSKRQPNTDRVIKMLAH